VVPARELTADRSLAACGPAPPLRNASYIDAVISAYIDYIGL
jgi:hypothetical protein